MMVLSVGVLPMQGLEPGTIGQQTRALTVRSFLQRKNIMGEKPYRALTEDDRMPTLLH